MKGVLRHALASLLCLALVLVCGNAYADVTLTLVRLSLTNVTDAEGGFQFDGGDVKLGAQLIGHYARVKRFSTVGTAPQNTAAVTITIFLLGADPPENLTLQGSHSFNTGGQIGSVSAASSVAAPVIGHGFTSPDGVSLTIHF
jgi:hypothetical protein